ncbi:MAG TPA: hypothetical protein VGH79_00195 [Gaiellaceae bacterium]|jgi:hypothetical protein
MKVQFIPMRAHLTADVVGGAVFAIVPLLNGARKQGKRQWIPYVALGALEVGLALLTKPETTTTPETRVAKLIDTAKRAKDTAAKGVAKVR